MSIKLPGATNGSVEIDVPAAIGSDLSVTIPATAGELTVKGTDGSVDLGDVNIDSSGRLLVGTSSAGAGAFASSLFAVQGVAGFPNVAGFMNLQRGEAATSITTNEELGVIGFTDNAANVFAKISGVADGTAGSGDYPGRLVFSTTADGAGSPTERMRIDNAGKVGIGQTSFSGDGERLGVKGDSNTFSTSCVRFINSDGTELFRVRNDGRFFTGSDGASPYNLTTANSANVWVGSDGALHRSTSSARYKTDIEDLENEYADQILSLRPVWYRSTAPGDQDHPDWSYYGFIAEEVAKVDPRLVFWKTHDHVIDAGGAEETVELDEPVAEGVQYDRLVPHLLNLIKRQKEQIEALEARLTALEKGGAS